MSHGGMTLITMTSLALLAKLLRDRNAVMNVTFVTAILVSSYAYYFLGDF